MRHVRAATAGGRVARPAGGRPRALPSAFVRSVCAGVRAGGGSVAFRLPNGVNEWVSGSHFLHVAGGGLGPWLAGHDLAVSWRVLALALR